MTGSDEALPRPLSGITVVDASCMLPGAVAARTLLDLGARLIKVEDPKGGDPMRHAPPAVGGVGVGFSVHYRGAQSVGLDLRTAFGARALRKLTARADVLMESFRPGTLDRWGLGLNTLSASNPRLITLSLPGLPAGASDAPTRVGHDLNFVALSGILHQLPAVGTPGVQLADVSTGLLGALSITAALLLRHQTGRGGALIQPIAAGPLPFMTWRLADTAAGSEFSMTDTIIGGAVPAYRIYTCADGLGLAVGCLEPKFWASFCAAVQRPDLVRSGLDPGAAGQACASAMAEHLAAQPRAHWLAAMEGKDLPVTAVHNAKAALLDPVFAGAGLTERTPMPDHTTLGAPGPAVYALGRTPTEPAPTLGTHTTQVLAEFGVI